MKSSTNRQCLKTLASVIAFSAFSLNLWAQQANVSLEVNDVQVEQALLKLRKESGYKFLFNHEEVKHAGRKTLNIKNSSLTKVLDALLEGTNLTYRIENNVVVIMPMQKADDKKNVRIQGTVVDKNDNPLPGASVVIPGTRKGTVTDIDGKFALETTDDVTRLQVSMIGMETQSPHRQATCSARHIGRKRKHAGRCGCDRLPDHIQGTQCRFVQHRAR